MIGTLGEIVFEVSEEKIRTFTGLKFSHGANYSEHAIHNRIGLIEFTGIKAASSSLDIMLDESLGLTVADEIKTLQDLLENHEAVKFILDGKVQGHNKWIIESLEVSHEIINNEGRTIKANVNIKLREYIEND